MASKVALAAKSTIQPLSGVGAIIYRISSRKQEIKSQYESVENWLARRKVSVDPTNVFEFVSKRRKTSEHFDFKRFLDWVAAGRIHWVVVQDLDRFGSKDPYQLMGFLGQLRDAGCQLWTVADDKSMNDGSDEAILIACLKGMTSEKECWVKSDRAHRSKQDLAHDGRWLGGPIPYGMDIECRRDGQVVWRYILESAQRVEEVVMGHKLRKYEYKGVIVVDGVETPTDALPTRNRKVGEYAYLVPSVRQDRIEALKLIFQWISEDLPGYQISKRLNDLGYHPIFGEKWYPARIKHLTINPAYQGVPAAYKTTQSGYYRYAGLDPETGAKTMGKAPDKSGKGGHYEKDEWLGPKHRLFDPVVDVSLVEAARAKLARPDKRPKAPKNAALWLSGLVVCDRCGKPMAGNMGQPEPRRKNLKRTYLCSTYLRHPGGHAPSGCKAHRTQHDVIELYLTKYLTDHSQTLEEYKQVHNNPPALRALLDRKKEVGDLLNHYTEMICRKINAIPDGKHFAPYDFEDPEHQLSFYSDIPMLMSFYDEIVSGRKRQLEAAVAEKETEFAKLVTGFARLTNDRAIEQANATMDVLDREIQGMRAELPTLDVQVRTLYEEASELSNRIRELKLAIEIGNDEQKGQAARRAVKEIRCGYRYEEHSAKTWSRLAWIKIIPHVGDPVHYDPVSGLIDANTARHT